MPPISFVCASSTQRRNFSSSIVSSRHARLLLLFIQSCRLSLSQRFAHSPEYAKQQKVRSFSSSSTPFLFYECLTMITYQPGLHLNFILFTSFDWQLKLLQFKVFCVCSVCVYASAGRIRSPMVFIIPLLLLL